MHMATEAHRAGCIGRVGQFGQGTCVGRKKLTASFGFLRSWGLVRGWRPFSLPFLRAGGSQYIALERAQFCTINAGRRDFVKISFHKSYGMGYCAYA